MVDSKLIDETIKLIKKTGVHYAYFFSQITSPTWIDLLKQKNFFKSPPSQEKKGNSISFPLWPASEYLSRMAEKEPEKVRDIFKEMNDTGNFHVHGNLLDSMISMPPEISATLIKKICKWFNYWSAEWNYEEYGKLIKHLSEGGQIKYALKLSQKIFKLHVNDNHYAYFGERNLSSTFDDYFYKDLLQQVEPILTENAHLESLTLFVWLIEDSMKKISCEENIQRDYSGPLSIKESSLNAYHDEPLDVLVFTLRDCADRLIPEHGKQILEEIGKKEHPLFKRIELYLRAQHPDVDAEGTKDVLKNREIYAKKEYKPERTLLLKKSFHLLGTEEQTAFLEYVDEGLNENYLNNLKEQNVSAEEIMKKDDYLKFTKLDAVKEYIDKLPDVWQVKYKRLKEEFGDIDHSDYTSHSPTAAWVGDPSLMSREEMAGMSIDELVSHLKKAEPSEAPHEDELEGTGKILQSLVMENPQEFAKNAAKFKENKRQFVRGLIEGIHQVTKNKDVAASLDLLPVFNLCKWVIGQPETEERTEGTYRPRDPNWQWTKREIAWFIRDLLDKSHTFLSIDYKEHIWKILAPLTDHEDPTDVTENEGWGAFDAVTTAMNTIRGEALHAVIYYGRWIKKHTQNDDSFSFEKIPDVRSVLEKHLDTESDPSYAIRSIYGQLFSLLMYIDHTWVEENRVRIFPPDAPEYRKIAWEAYVTFNNPHRLYFGLLKDEYFHAVGQLGEATEEERKATYDPDERLTEHLMVIYWNGGITLYTPEELLPVFYQKASEELKAHAIEFIGRNLEYADTESWPRLKQLWEKRMEEAKTGKKSDYEKEITAFGYWFIKLSDCQWLEGKEHPWLIDQLHGVLKLYNKIDLDNFVIKWLREVQHHDQYKVLDSLGLIVEGYTGERWSYIRLADDIKDILSNAMKSDDDTIREKAIDLINEFGRRGDLSYRELLEQS